MSNKKSNYDVERLLERTKAVASVLQPNDAETPTQGGGDSMSDDKRRSVFQVFAVDPKTAKILVDERVVARDSSEATLKAVAKAQAGGQTIDFDRVDIGCTVVIEGFIRPKKETQKVVIEKEEKEEVTA